MTLAGTTNASNNAAQQPPSSSSSNSNLGVSNSHASNSIMFDLDAYDIDDLDPTALDKKFSQAAKFALQKSNSNSNAFRGPKANSAQTQQTLPASGQSAHKP